MATNNYPTAARASDLRRAALAVLLASMGVAMLIDWLATLYDSRWRYVLTAAALASAGLTSVGWLTLAWRRSLRWDRVAGDVETKAADQLPGC